MKEVALYLDVLRQRRGITQAEIASALGVELRQVQRWLTEAKPMKLEIAQQISECVKASALHVFRLLKDDATPEMSRDLASQQLGSELMQRVNHAAEQATEDDLDIAEIAGYLRSHPELIHPVRSFVDGADRKPKRSRRLKE